MIPDALLAALVAFCVTLLAFLFWPALAEQIPELAVAVGVYMVALFAASGLFMLIRGTLHK